MLLAAVLWEDAEAISQAKQLLHNFLNKGQVIPANLREVRILYSSLSIYYSVHIDNGVVL